MCGAALTTACVMLSGSVSMVSPPPGTALLILAWPALSGRLSPPVDSSCSCGIAPYPFSVQTMNIRLECWAAHYGMKCYIVRLCHENSKATNFRRKQSQMSDVSPIQNLQNDGYSLVLHSAGKRRPKQIAYQVLQIISTIFSRRPGVGMLCFKVWGVLIDGFSSF